LTLTAGVVFSQYEDAQQMNLQRKYCNPFLVRPEVDYTHSFSPMTVDTTAPFEPYHGQPIYDAGDTYYDMQHNSSKGRMIAVDPEGGVHVSWMDALDPMFTNRVTKYNYFHYDSLVATGNGWLCGSDGIRVDDRNYSGYTNISVDDEHLVPTVSYHDRGTDYISNAAFDGIYYASFGANRCAFITPVTTPSPYLLPGSGYDVVAIWPKIAQIDTTIWMVSTASNSDDTVSGEIVGSRLVYYRGYIKPVMGGFSELTFDEPVEIEDDQIGITADITAHKGPEGNEIAMAYVRHDTIVSNDTCYCGIENYYTTIFDAAGLMYRKSSDMGATWSDPDTVNDPMVHIYSDYPDSLYLGYYIDSLTGDTIDVIRPVYSRPIDISMTYGDDGNLHMVWGGAILTPHEGWEFTCEGVCSTGAYCQEVIYYWNEMDDDLDTVVFDPIWRGAGCHELGGISHLGYSQEPTVAVDDDNNVFVFWEQLDAEYWWVEAPDSFFLDIQATSGYPNSEIYCAVYNPDSGYWSDPLNISNTYTFLCSTGTCSSEVEVTVAERVDDYVHLSFVLDYDPGLYVYEEGDITLGNFKYLRLPKEGLIIAAYAGDLIDAIDEDGNPIAAMPKSFRLGRNWPNPFNAATAFWFDVYEPDKYTIDVVDINGRVVSHLVSKELKTGRHGFTWDGNSDNGWVVPSGVYFLRARNTAGTEFSRKITLLK